MRAISNKARSAAHICTTSLVALLLLGFANPINLKNAEKYYELGSQAERSGDYLMAEEYYARALWNAKMGRAPDSGISAVSYNLGRVKGYLCKPDEAEELLLDALRIEENAAEPEISLISMRLFELARLSASQSRYDTARRYYARVIPLVRKLNIENEDPVGFALVLIDYALVLEFGGDIDAADAVREEADRLRNNHPQAQAGFVAKPYGRSCEDSLGTTPN